MFSSFPAELRKQGLHAAVWTILQLYTLMSRGLIQNLGGLYCYGERLVVKDPREKGPYTVAFFAFFLDIHISPDQNLDDAVIHSDAFVAWMRENAPGEIPSPQLVDQFLDAVLNRTFDFQAVAAALADRRGENPEMAIPFSPPGQGGHDSEVSHADQEMDELIRMMKEIAEQQKQTHRGGQRYIGAGGISPFGYAGRSSNSIRVGGRNVLLSARMVLNDSRYFPLNLNATLSDNNEDAAFAALKGVAEHTSHMELDIEETIRMGAKCGGLFLPHLKREEEEQLNVMLFLDNGGSSMDPHIPVVRTLFRKMKTRFTHDLKIFYFHNIIATTVYTDEARMRGLVPLEKVLREGKHQRVFIVGDASMGSYELHGTYGGKSGFDNLCEMAAAFPRLTWLNPVPEGAWGRTRTIGDIRSIVQMFPLTPRGIERAVRHMNQASDELKLHQNFV